jgi:hypothetical protein
MTPKILARMITPRPFYAMWQRGLVTQDGRTFEWMNRQPYYTRNLEVGDRVWIAKRLPVSGYDWCFEVYQITIEQTDYGTPKLWLGKGRQLLLPT